MEELFELLRDESRWCRGTVARTAHGSPCYADSPKAAKWCLEGGIIKFNIRGAEARKLWLAAKGMGYPDLPALNDHGGHALVIECIKRAMRG